MKFPTILRELRESRNLTQEQLAQKLNVSRPTIAGYETKQRQPDFDKLEQLAAFFQVSIDYLITGREQEEPTPLTPYPPNSKLLDRKVNSAYQKLRFQEKQEVLHYIQLLENTRKLEELEASAPGK